MVNPMSKMNLVGVEIDDGVVRAVELAPKAGEFQLVNWGSNPLPEDAVREGVVNDPEAVGLALSELWSGVRLKSRKIVLGVANQSVLVRFASFPRVPDSKLDSFIRNQAQASLPVALNTMVFDYAVTGERVGDEGVMMDVLFVAAKREMLDAFLRGAELARLRPQDVEVLTLVLDRTAGRGNSGLTLANVNISNGLSQILIATGNVPRLARIISTGAKDALRDADSILELLSDDGEAGAGAGGELPAELLPWSRSLAGEIRSSLNYYQSQSNASPVEAVRLSGPGARFPGLAAALTQSLAIPVAVIDPLLAAGVHRGPAQEGRPFGPEYTLSLCLALQR